MTARCPCWLSAGLWFLLFGCSYSYHFDLSGTVRTAEGNALAGVKIVVDLAEQIGGSGYRAELESGPDGSYAYELSVPGGGSPPAFALWFSKAGYIEEKIKL